MPSLQLKPVNSMSTDLGEGEAGSVVTATWQILWWAGRGRSSSRVGDRRLTAGWRVCVTLHAAEYACMCVGCVFMDT